MIRSLSLRNWRAYSSVNLSFGGGVTFIVAPNGVGKTSLVEGVRFALYGNTDSEARLDEAVRLGAPSATATVDLELPSGELLSITRELPRKLQRSHKPPASGQLAGRHLDAQAIDALLRDAYSADPSFLSRLTMLRGDAFRSSTDLNLREHLCDYFGIGSLQNAVESLDAWLKRADREISATKKVNPIAPRRLKELRDAVAAANTRVTEATRAHDAATKAATDAADQQRIATAHSQWQARQADVTATLHTLVADAAAVGVAVTAPEQVVDATDRAEADLVSEIDDVRRERAQAEGQATAIRIAVDELDGADATCPVCRRPLTEQDAATARAEHRAELDRLAAQSAAAAEREHRLLQQLTDVRQLRQRLHRLTTTDDEPPVPDGPAEQLAAAVRATAEAQQHALDALVDARAAAAAAARDLAIAEQDTAAEALLRRQFAAYATADATRRALRLTTDRLLSETIEPLTLEVADRWKRLFPDRGPVLVDADGQLTRNVNGESLPFSSFSGGEQVAAQILLRLLVLQTATRAGFCWIDEPLEHLDPATRRHVVSLATRLAATTPISQIVMTTYEEPLAWRMSRRAPELVHLTYIRPHTQV